MEGDVQACPRLESFFRKKEVGLARCPRCPTFSLLFFSLTLHTHSTHTHITLTSHSHHTPTFPSRKKKYWTSWTSWTSQSSFALFAKGERKTWTCLDTCPQIRSFAERRKKRRVPKSNERCSFIKLFYPSFFLRKGDSNLGHAHLSHLKTLLLR